MVPLDRQARPVKADYLGATEESEEFSIPVPAEPAASPETLRRTRAEIQQASAIYFHLTETQQPSHPHAAINVSAENITGKAVRGIIGEGDRFGHGVDLVQRENRPE